MTQKRNTEFVGVSLTPAARDALHRLSLAMSAAFGRRIPMSEAVIYAEQLLTSRGAIAKFEALAERNSR